MPRRDRSSPAPSAESPADRLQASVEAIADGVRVISDIVEHIREDLSWLTRNGIPHQPLHVLIHRMPLVSDGESGDGSFEFSLVSPPARDPTVETLTDAQLRAAVIDQIVDRLAEPLGHLAQEQLNSLLSVLDDSHRQVLQAIRDPRSVQSPQLPPSSQRARKKRNSQVKPTAASAPMNPPADPPPQKGKLF